MFLLYAIAIGLAVGLLLGGRIDRLGEIRLRWLPVIVGGLALQVAVFSSVVADRIGALGPPLYVASTAAVLAVLVRNLRVPGLPLMALGGLANLAAILANGGSMPTSQAALEVAGRAVPAGYTNSSLAAQPALAALTDLYGLPAWMPLANVFSVGDVLIGVGLAIAVVAAMVRRTHGAPRQLPQLDGPGGTGTS